MMPDDPIYPDTADGLAAAARELRAQRGDLVQDADEVEPIDLSIQAQYERCRDLMRQLEDHLGIKDTRDADLLAAKQRIAELEQATAAFLAEETGAPEALAMPSRLTTLAFDPNNLTALKTRR
jgi:hypothetical protein